MLIFSLQDNTKNALYNGDLLAIDGFAKEEEEFVTMKSMFLQERLKTKILERKKKRERVLVFNKTQEECVLSSHSHFHEERGTADVGILEGCHNCNHICVPDSLSSLGGFCAALDITERVVSQVAPDAEQMKTVKIRESLRKILFNEDSLADTATSPFVNGGVCIEISRMPDEDVASVDVGILVQECEDPKHPCKAVTPSSTGLHCINAFGNDYVLLLSDNNDQERRKLSLCSYRNGTHGGKKCHGFSSCAGLSSTFIAQNIGCGSCNGYGACQAISGMFCNAGK